MTNQGPDILDLLVRVGLPVLTFGLGTAISAQRNSASDSVALLNELISDAKDLQQAGTEYWVHDVGHANARLNEAKVRGSCFSLSSSVNQWLQMNDSLAREFQETLDDIIDLMTGGTFESSERVPDFGRAVEARNRCAELIALARRERSKRNAPFSIFADIARWIASTRFIKSVTALASFVWNFPKRQK